MIESHRADWFRARIAKKPKPHAARVSVHAALPWPNQPDNPAFGPSSNPHAVAVEAIIIQTLNASAPVKLVSPKAPEVFKPGTRHVFSGPNACKRWGGR